MPREREAQKIVVSGYNRLAGSSAIVVDVIRKDGSTLDTFRVESPRLSFEELWVMHGSKAVRGFREFYGVEAELPPSLQRKIRFFRIRVRVNRDFAYVAKKNGAGTWDGAWHTVEPDQVKLWRTREGAEQWLRSRPLIAIDMDAVIEEVQS